MAADGLEDAEFENCIIEFVRGVALPANRFVLSAPPARAAIARLESKRRKVDRFSTGGGGEDATLVSGEGGAAAALGGFAADAAPIPAWVGEAPLPESIDTKERPE